MDDLSNPWSAAGASAVAFVVGAGASGDSPHPALHQPARGSGVRARGFFAAALPLRKQMAGDRFVYYAGWS